MKAIQLQQLMIYVLLENNFNSTYIKHLLIYIFSFSTMFHINLYSDFIGRFNYIVQGQECNLKHVQIGFILINIIFFL